MPLWRGSQSPPRPRQSSAPANAAPRTSGSCLFTVRTVGSIHSVSVHVRCDGGGSDGGAAAALYNYTLMCIIVEKSGHTHYTVHTIIFVLLQVQDCIPFICTHMQGQRSSDIRYFSLVLKFEHSEKHTKICAIFLMVWTFTK